MEPLSYEYLANVCITFYLLCKSTFSDLTVFNCFQLSFSICVNYLHNPHVITNGWFNLSMQVFTLDRFLITNDYIPALLFVPSNITYIRWLNRFQLLTHHRMCTFCCNYSLEIITFYKTTHLSPQPPPP